MEIRHTSTPEVPRLYRSACTEPKTAARVPASSLFFGKECSGLDSKMNRVCIFGDSIAKGVVMDANNKYVFLKDSFVSLIQRAYSFAVENFARFGCTIERGCSMVDKCSDEISTSDVTVLEFGGNDCDFDWSAVAADPSLPHECKTPLDKFTKTYEDLVKHVRSLKSRPVIMSLPPIDAERYFAHISKGLNSDNILKFIGDVQHIARWQEMYNIAVLNIAKKCDVEVLDTRTAFLPRPDFRDYICEDGIHPNAKGHELIYSTLRKQLA